MEYLHGIICPAFTNVFVNSKVQGIEFGNIFVHLSKAELLCTKARGSVFSLVEMWLNGCSNPTAIDAVTQGNWSLSNKLRLECFVVVQ